MHYIPRQRLRYLLAACVLATIACAAVGFDAHVRRQREAGRIERTRAVVALLGFGDLALSSGARWLRHPSQTEPGAPFADLPGAVDIDPAGAALGPPLPVLEVGARGLRVMHRSHP